MKGIHSKKYMEKFYKSKLCKNFLKRLRKSVINDKLLELQKDAISDDWINSEYYLGYRDALEITDERLSNLAKNLNKEKQIKK